MDAVLMSWDAVKYWSSRKRSVNSLDNDRTMENGPFIDDFLMKPSTYKGFSHHVPYPKITFIYAYCLVVEPYPSEKYEFVNWDDDIPNIWKNKVMFQTTIQQLLQTSGHICCSLHLGSFINLWDSAQIAMNGHGPVDMGSELSRCNRNWWCSRWWVVNVYQRV